MSRIGGRNAWIAWPVGLICLAVVLALAWLALPMFPAAVSFLGSMVPGMSAEPSATESDSGEAVTPAACRALYSEALWASLSTTDGSTLVQDSSAPVTTATALTESLSPTVDFTCTWTAGERSISTTLAKVGADASAIAAASLPEQGFSCATVASVRTRCERADTEAETLETIELGEGMWLSTSQVGWRPESYASRLADKAWRE